MVLDIFYNEKNKYILKNIVDKHIQEIAIKNINSRYLVSNVFDDDGFDQSAKSFWVNCNNNFQIIDINFQKKIFDRFTNAIFDVTYGRVSKSKNSPFNLDSCFFRVYFDLSDDNINEHKPYNIEMFYSSGFSDNLKDVDPPRSR